MLSMATKKPPSFFALTVQFLPWHGTRINLKELKMFNLTGWFCGFVFATSLCSNKSININFTSINSTINTTTNVETTTIQSFDNDFQETKIDLKFKNDENKISYQNDPQPAVTFLATDSSSTVSLQNFTNINETKLNHVWISVLDFTQGFLSYSLYNQTSLYLTHHRSMLRIFYLISFCLLFTILLLGFLFVKICFKRKNQKIVAIKKRQIFRTPLKTKRSTKKFSEKDERCYLLVPNAEEEEEINY